MYRAQWYLEKFCSNKSIGPLLLFFLLQTTFCSLKHLIRGADKRNIGKDIPFESHWMKRWEGIRSFKNEEGNLSNSTFAERDKSGRLPNFFFVYETCDLPIIIFPGKEYNFNWWMIFYVKVSFQMNIPMAKFVSR